MADRLRSKKPIKEFKEISLPFQITFDEDVEGGINGKMFSFPKGKTARITFEQYEVLFNSDYAKHLIR